MTHSYSQTIEKGCMIPQTMLFIASEATDKVYFLQKDGLSTMLIQVNFSKRQRDLICPIYEFKSNKIKVFTYHEGNFYIMDETMQIKAFVINPHTNKVKFEKTLDMNK